MAPEQFSGIFMMIVLFALMYFMMIRPQKKKDKEIKSMRDNLSVGDDVITIGGIHGKVVKVNDEIIVLEMPHAKQRIEFSKWAVGSVAKKVKVTTATEDIETASDEKEDDK